MRLGLGRVVVVGRARETVEMVMLVAENVALDVIVSSDVEDVASVVEDEASPTSQRPFVQTSPVAQ